MTLPASHPPEHEEIPPNPARAEDETPADAVRRRAGESKHGTRFSASEVYQNIRESGLDELERSASALGWSALAAGLVIGFSFLVGGFVSTLVTEPYKHAASAAVYPVGFVFVVLGRNQLFTENTLEPIIPLLAERTGAMFAKTARLWAIVLVANLVGALVFALVLAYTPAVNGEVLTELDRIAEHATREGFWVTVEHGIFGGWLVALMTWLIASTVSASAQILLIWLTTLPIAALSFAHSIAGSTEAFYRAARGDEPWSAMLGRFVVPAIIGNVLGGVSLVALLNHSQVAAEREQ